MKYNTRKTFQWLMFLSLLSLFIYPTTLLAYVDPGSITIMLQVASAFVIGGIIAFRNYIFSAFKTLILRKPSKETNEENIKNENN